MRRAGFLAIAVCALALTATAVAAVRAPAPPIAGSTVAGGFASLAALRGKPVFINVWSSW